MQHAFWLMQAQRLAGAPLTFAMDEHYINIELLQLLHTPRMHVSHHTHDNWVRGLVRGKS